MAKNYLQTLIRLNQGNGVINTQNYLDVDLKTFTHGSKFRTGVGRIGMLMMVEEDERFEFHEALCEEYARNPKVWRGKMLNVARDKQGRYQVNFRHLELNKKSSIRQIVSDIRRELLTAQKVLGL